jgi:transposase
LAASARSFTCTLSLKSVSEVSRLDQLLELADDLRVQAVVSLHVIDFGGPGVGKVLALVLLYAIHDIRRFAGEGQFLSYARLVRPGHESAGKVVGSGVQKIGNAHLRWAFGEAACLFLRASERAKQWKEKQLKKRAEKGVLAILAARLARAVYHLWRKEEAFDEGRFWQGQGLSGPTQGKGR